MTATRRLCTAGPAFVILAKLNILNRPLPLPDEHRTSWKATVKRLAMKRVMASATAGDSKLSLSEAAARPLPTVPGHLTASASASASAGMPVPVAADWPWRCHCWRLEAFLDRGRGHDLSTGHGPLPRRLADSDSASGSAYRWHTSSSVHDSYAVFRQ